MNRRDFVFRAGAAAGFGFGVGGTSAALSPINRHGEPRLKIALNAYSFAKLLNDHNRGRGGLTLLDLVSFCAKHNIDGLDPTGYFFPGYPEPPPDAFVNELKRRAFECGIGITGTGVRNNFTVADKERRKADVQHIKAWVVVAAQLGAPVLRVFADTQMKDQTWQTASGGAAREEVEEWMAAHLGECAAQGKEHGVIIGVQNHGDFLKTGEEHLRLIDRVNSEWCRPIVDTGYYKTEDPYLDMAKVAPFAVNWQIKQSPFGAGHETATDLKKLMTLVRQSGYRGYLPIETLSVRGAEYDPFKVVPPFVEELRQAIAATSDVAGPPPVNEPPAETSPGTAPKTPVPDSNRVRKPANKNKDRQPKAAN